MDQVLVYIATNGSLCMSPADPPGPIALQVSLFFFASTFQSLQDLSTMRLCVICNACPLMERLFGMLLSLPGEPFCVSMTPPRPGCGMCAVHAVQGLLQK